MRKRFGIGVGLRALAIVFFATLAFASESDRSNTTTRLPAHLPTSAVGQDVLIGEEAQLEARLLISSGPNTFAGVLFSMAEGWHVYWRNPGDTGLAPRIELKAKGYETGPIIWPAPETFKEADGLFTTFGYANEVLLSMPLHGSDPSPYFCISSAEYLGAILQ